jgi:hypothetical protein
LHTESALNKFAAVLPIGLGLSVMAAMLYIAIAVWKKIHNQIGIGIL